MKNILITGGPVHAYLDAVKIITNTFRGSFMADLATELSKDANVTYLCNKASKIPSVNPRLKVIYHDGFDDYRIKILNLSPKMDAVILGAAVANLIPHKAIEGKFPSHNYKPGDLVPLIFKIAPRVIDEVKKVAPRAHLFGFKLLDGVDHEELIRAAYEVLIESKATAVIANDRQNLTQKYIVTKERVVHPVNHDKLSNWIWEMLQDEYYQTVFDDNDEPSSISFTHELNLLKERIKRFEKEGGFYTTPEGYIFGTLAQRCDLIRLPSGYRGFWTTGRGKKELESFVRVNEVDHTIKKVFTLETKATLNAPLLDHIFKSCSDVDSIIHAHVHSKFKVPKKLPVFDYAPPGTVRDSIRDIKGSFIIKDHGCFLLYDRENKLI
jgi:hypothetical protein